MNKLFTAFAGLVCLAFSAFGQGIVRNGVTTNSTTVSPANNDVLTYQTAHGKWTNSPLVATATNAIANMSGLGTNTTLRGLTSTIGMTNTGAFSNSGAVYIGGAAYVGGSITADSGSVTFNGSDFKIIGAGAVSLGGTVSITNAPRFVSATASTILSADGTKDLASVANGAGMLTNDGAGVFGWMAIPSSSAASTNNPVQEVGRLSVTNNYVNTLKAAFQGGPTPALTNYLYATNGDSQFYNLTRHTNIVFVPLSGADATNSPGISALFKQDATGGFFPTNNGQTITIATNPLAETWVQFSITGGGATNVTPNKPESFRPPSNLDVVEWNTASGTWTNVGSSGSGYVARTNNPTINDANMIGSPISITPSTGDADGSIATTLFVNASLIASNANFVRRSGDSLTNLVAVHGAVLNILAATNSVLTNMPMSFAVTNTIRIYHTNWWVQWTNFVGFSEDTTGTKTVRIIPSAPGQNITNTWPSGAMHGYKWETNSAGPIWNVFTNGKAYVVSVTHIGTNLHPTVTVWE